jgi:serine/threonine protein kinase
VHDLRGEISGYSVLKRLKNYSRIERFERELDAIKKLDHPSVVKVIDSDLKSDPAYIVMEHCSGGALSASPPFWQGSPQIAFGIFQDVCSAVVHAHAHGIIHRDIKPANIFLRGDQGPAVLGDFGLAFIEGFGPRPTETDEVVGPRTFIAPELEDGRLDDVTPKCDVYSLGKLLYWLLSDGRIFSREKHREVQWDLKRRTAESKLGWTNVYMEHVNRLLDLMIVVNPEDRRSAENVLILAKRASGFIENLYNPVSREIPQPCTYCGQGVYRIVVQDTGQVEDFGFMARGTADWKVLVCDMCGNVQAFRIENAQAKDWWQAD